MVFIKVNAREVPIRICWHDINTCPGSLAKNIASICTHYFNFETDFLVIKLQNLLQCLIAKLGLIGVQFE